MESKKRGVWKMEKKRITSSGEKDETSVRLKKGIQNKRLETEVHDSKPETDFETELNRNGSYWKLWRVQNATINLLRNELKKQQLKWDQKENKYLQKIAKLEYMLYGEESEIQGRI